MNDVMIDLETLGTRPGCVVLAVGAVTFDPTTGMLGNEFYEVINLSSAMRAGLTIDPDTAAWWAQQSDDARQVVTLAESETLSLTLVDTLERFNDYLGDGKNIRLWGNGAGFDQPILEAAYHAARLGVPWQFFNNRCYRTLKSLAPEVKLVRTGIYHNALDDAVDQAQHACSIFKHLTQRGATWPVLKQPSSERSATGPSPSTASPTRSSRSPATPGTPTGSSGCPVGDLF